MKSRIAIVLALSSVFTLIQAPGAKADENRSVRAEIPESNIGS